MSDTTKGQCLCGASSYHFAGAPEFAIQCYCGDCRHVSGGGHLPQIAVASLTFESIGNTKTFSRKSDAGNDLFFTFCADCGSPLYKATARLPHLVFVYPGSLTEAPDVRFDKHVFESGRQPWDTA